MSQLWSLLLYQPLVNALIFLYKVFGGNLGLAIIALTILVRLLVVPLMKPQLEASKKMQKLAPELDKLKKKFADDKQKLAQAQMELYKKEGINPAAGCLPQIIQLLILIALYQAFSQVLRPDGQAVIEKLNQILYSSLRLPDSAHLNLNFFMMDLGKSYSQSRSPLSGVLLILSAVFQFLSAKMMMPQAELASQEAKKTETKKDDFSSAMQMQATYMFPLMTLFIGFSFSSGLVLYWMLFSLLSMVQQYLVGGWGGLASYAAKLKVILRQAQDNTERSRSIKSEK